jgi:hypothetical protein
MNHFFIQSIPPGTQMHDSLRLAVQGEAFLDRQWADDKTFAQFVKTFDLILAVMDTRNPRAGFVCYYQDAQGETITNAFGEMPLPNKPIIRIAATGNHFLSVESHPAMGRGAIRNAFITPIRQILKRPSSCFFTKVVDTRELSQRGQQSGPMLIRSLFPPGFTCKLREGKYMVKIDFDNRTFKEAEIFGAIQNVLKGKQGILSEYCLAKSKTLQGNIQKIVFSSKSAIRRLAHELNKVFDPTFDSTVDERQLEFKLSSSSR